MAVASFIVQVQEYLNKPQLKATVGPKKRCQYCLFHGQEAEVVCWPMIYWSSDHYMRIMHFVQGDLIEMFCETHVFVKKCCEQLVTNALHASRGSQRYLTRHQPPGSPWAIGRRTS